ncbi:MAG: primosomal protein N' [Candidatus Yanofskybacteria bacterium RIFCSPLOWO2_01_FULL_41_34]|uniref:Primosomal protein N n=1 Tax=Candidatus Yanofskybacteria bacterium RIFCSPHIGHO2_01_FULL_41_26 TaxID=1802661 RepID=A0A1F8EDW4_9BACT|nr:MAG: primosomal protein N' [Candidatus Yanofskybacteria bacterium RIFCSPHIGHO2_01_FULL_41_26]OGN22976.1 MAG: primosomal protein N' [Candidatus Yanofskybacteria bacterium RIFCSPLOWO2_01_FULL_41_34]
MYIIEVVPLTILPANAPQLLSYFFNEKLKKGAMVEVMIGKRNIRAAVATSTPLENQKIILKKSGFQLKKISAIINKDPQVSSKQFKIALWLSKYYYAPLGYCLKTVLPPFFLKRDYEITLQREPLQISAKVPFVQKTLLILSRAKDTLDNILPFIKTAVLEQGQVVLVIPDMSTIGYFYEALAPNYRVSKISSILSNKDFYGAWKKIASGQSDIILGTRQALFMPFANLKLVIVDDVLHEFYKSDMTPKYNTPDLAKVIANLYGAKTIFVSPIIGVENYFYLKNKKYELLDEKKSHLPIKILGTVEEIKNGNFLLFSRELKKNILRLTNPYNQNKKILIFSPRRGHSGVLVCQSCGYAIKCKECGTAFRIHKTTNLILVCHHCSRSLKIPEKCPNCGGFKLKTAGPAGTQKIYEEVRKLLEYNEAKKVPVLILDADVVKNETEEEEIISELQKPHTLILIATQMIFSHRYNIKFDLIGVLNADSLANIPDFRTEERLFYQIEKLLDFQPKNMIIQTYNLENQTILTASDGNYKNFYGKELAIRKVFSYPPYSRLIKLTFRHKYKDKALHESLILSGKLKMAIIQKKLDKKIKLIDSHPTFTEKERGLFVYNIILKVLPELENIKDILQFVPSNWSVDVDPKTII